MQSTTHGGGRCCDVIAPVDMTCSRFPQILCYSLQSLKSNTLLFMHFPVTHKNQFPSRFTALFCSVAWIVGMLAHWQGYWCLRTQTSTLSTGTIIAKIFHRPIHPRVTQLVETLRSKPEGRGFDSRWRNWNFHLHNPSGRTMALGSTQPLTEMSTRNISRGVKTVDA
jgi:hypothetical protein